MEGLDNLAPLCASIYPAAWRVEIVNEGIHRGSEYVRWEPPDILDTSGWLTDTVYQLLLGAHEEDLGSRVG